MIRAVLLTSILLLLLGTPVHAQEVSLDRVEAALRSGANWHATELLQPALDAGSTKPEILVAGARAAAGWEGWPTVTRLLSARDWLGSRFDAVGYRLLTDAALAEDRPSDALKYARLALPATLILRVNDEAGRRWINLARAHERLGAWDSAGVAYTQAAALLPEVSDWLALRAAGVTADSATRARLYTTVTSPVARARIGPTEALAWTRADEKERAAREYAAAGSKAVALRLRWEAHADDPTRQQIGSALIGLVRDTRSSNESRQAIAILDDYRVPLSREDSFVVARRAADLGRNRTAIEILNALAGQGGLTAPDRLALGDAQANNGNWRAAELEYARIESGPLAGRAAYQSARAKLRQGKGSAAIADLNRIVAKFPSDTFAAGTALYLLADLALDASRTDSARTLLITLADKYPGNEFAQRGALIAPLIAFAEGRLTVARNELLTAIEQHQLTGFDADAGRYWIGRAHLALGDRAEAHATFRSLLDRGPENYYAILAAARLDTVPWTLPRSRMADTANATPPPALERAALLSQLGLDFEAGLERAGALVSATSRDELVGLGQALIQDGHPALAPALANRIVRAGGSRDGDVWRMTYVLPYETALTTSAARAGIDPWLAAAVIRQESGFNPHARSGADARGLMQLLPGSGRDIARALGMREFDPALLYQPELNLAFGTRHLARELARFPELERSLAAYNAGPGKAAQWSRTLLDGSSAGDGPLADPELFVERIPYLETRNYIRRITVNREVYGLLYGE